METLSPPPVPTFSAAMCILENPLIKALEKNPIFKSAYSFHRVAFALEGRILSIFVA